MLLYLREIMTEIVSWASLVTQWGRICRPVQGTWVRSLIWEDPTCHRAAEPRNHSSLSPESPEPMLHHERSRGSEEPTRHS